MESLEEYIRYLWPDRDPIYKPEHVYMCTTQSNAEKYHPQYAPKIPKPFEPQYRGYGLQRVQQKVSDSQLVVFNAQ